jgi:hypothetical protein
MQPRQQNSFLKRIRNKYRLVILNENTFEEIVAFQLTRWTVYVALSMMFIVLVGLTIALIAFTPLKFYIPGYGRAGSDNEYESLKLKADSIEKTLLLKQQYFDNIERILKGNEVPADTAVLKIKKRGLGNNK